MENSQDIRTLSLTVAYDGTPFAGFARQKEPHVHTVQGELEQALEVLFRRPVPTVCAGRTDAGVHAIGQVVSFDLTPAELEARSLPTLMRSINALVDDHISVSSVDEREPGFSARFDAKWREYRYRICTDYARPVLVAPVVWHLRGAELDLDAMNRAARHLVGEHDFKSFCVSASAEGKTTNRNVMELEAFPEEVLGSQLVCVRVVGNAFLHSMIRIMVGTLVEVGRGRKDPDWVAAVLEARDRRAAAQTAPASGLTFWHVEY